MPRQRAYNSASGAPRTESTSRSKFWYSEWLTVDIPEQARYTAVLTLHPMDVSQEEDDYPCVRSLRRALRLSTSARCSPLFGSDMLKDDQRVGFNGGLAKFYPDWLGSRNIIAITELTGAEGKFPDTFDMPMGWSKPSWGDYQVGDVDVIDIRRIPSMRPGYCYGSKIAYVDKAMNQSIWDEIYDPNLELWKVVPLWLAPATDVVTGDVYAPMNVIEQWYDIQNHHFTHIATWAQDGTPNTLPTTPNFPLHDLNPFNYPPPPPLHILLPH